MTGLLINVTTNKIQNKLKHLKTANIYLCCRDTGPSRTFSIKQLVYYKQNKIKYNKIK